MREIRSHTALRGIAALLVVLYHYRINLPAAFSPDSVTQFFAHSGSFVDFFFLLSGFVISYVYMRPAPEGASVTQHGVNWASYFRSRFARIYPLHILTLFWMCLIFVYKQDIAALLRFDQVLSNIFLVQAWGLHGAFALNFPSWSISGEAAAYLIYPLVAYFFWRAPKIHWVLLLALICFGVIVAHDYLVHHAEVPWERVGLMRAIPGFILGTVLYWARALSARLPDTALTCAQVGLFGVLIAFLHFGVGLVFLVPVFAALILVTWEDRGAVARGLSVAPLHALGALSYTIYLTHVPVRATGYIVWPKLAGWVPGPWNEILFVIVCTAMTFACSWVIYRFFEIPMRDWLRARPR